LNPPQPSLRILGNPARHRGRPASGPGGRNEIHRDAAAFVGVGAGLQFMGKLIRYLIGLG
jgi:hypothetical protein